MDIGNKTDTLAQLYALKLTPDYRINGVYACSNTEGVFTGI